MRRVRPVHWVARFVSSLWPAGPRREDVEWAERLLSDHERAAFARMSNPDRRHAVRVARAVDRNLDATVERRDEVLAAALLHDVGKTVSGLGTYGRVIATISGAIGGRGYAEIWQDTTGFTRRVGLYLRYTELGAELLSVGGSRPWVVAWAREHHLDEEAWSLPPDIARVLVAADDC